MDQAHALGSIADAVIVGSALIRHMQSPRGLHAARELAAELAHALHTAHHKAA